MSRRREPRVEVSFDVKVWGLDRHGKPFMQHARTLDATRLGAKLMGIDCVNVGETIGIQNGDKKSRFKVVWIGRENTPKAGQIGVDCLEPEKAIFDMQAIKAQNHVDSINHGFVLQKSARPARVDIVTRRRKHPRYPCTGSMELRQSESGPPAQGNLSDISLTGCYVEALSTLPVGSMLLFSLRTQNLQIEGRAVVKISHEGVGMGIAFLYLSAENQQTLEFLIGTLAGMQEKGAEDGLALASAEAPPEPAASKIEAPNPGSVSEQLTSAIQRLTELEQALVAEKVDPGLIVQFHDAIAHARQAARTVQQWLNLHSSGDDSSTVLQEHEGDEPLPRRAGSSAGKQMS